MSTGCILFEPRFTPGQTELPYRIFGAAAPGRHR
jgi:hypothetical protein